MHIESERAVYLPLLETGLPAREAAAMYVDLRAVVIAARHGAAPAPASRWRARARARDAPLRQRQGIAYGCADGFSPGKPVCGNNQRRLPH